MNYSRKSLFLVIALIILAPTKAQQSPSGQLNKVISQTIPSLFALSTLGPSNITFNQLSQYIGIILGTIELVSDPYWNSRINYITTLNDQILNQINQFEAQTAGTSSMLFAFLDSINSVVSSQLANIGGVLGQLQAQNNPLFDQLQQSISSVNDTLKVQEIKIDINTGYTVDLASKLAAGQAKLAADSTAIDLLSISVPKFRRSRSSDFTTPVSQTANSVTYLLNFATPYITTPKVILIPLYQSSPAAGDDVWSDEVVNNVSSTGVTVTQLRRFTTGLVSNFSRLLMLIFE